MDELAERYPQAYRRLFVEKRQRRIRFCRAEKLNGCAAGTFVMPPEKKTPGTECFFAFCVTENKVVFADDYEFVRHVLDRLSMTDGAELSSPGMLFYHLLEFLLADDSLFLQDYEDNLTKLEEQLMDGREQDFDRRIFNVRRELSSLGIHYQQLSEVGEVLRQYETELGREREAAMFGLYEGKARRLSDTVLMLKEYSLQLQEMHQTQLELRQNEIMKFLTVVTTIFMPLTLVTGWYGMNFENMPELKQPHGYGAVCVICALAVAAEIWIFVKKKWFR